MYRTPGTLDPVSILHVLSDVVEKERIALSLGEYYLRKFSTSLLEKGESFFPDQQWCEKIKSDFYLGHVHDDGATWVINSYL